MHTSPSLDCNGNTCSFSFKCVCDIRPKISLRWAHTHSNPASRHQTHPSLANSPPLHLFLYSHKITHESTHTNTCSLLTTPTTRVPIHHPLSCTLFIYSS